MLTLTAEGCAGRREELIKAARADLLIVANPCHIQYLSGMFNTSLALSNWGPNYLIIDGSTGESKLIVHNLMANAAKTAHADQVEVWRSYDQATTPGVD